MSEAYALAVLEGTAPMPEEITVEAVFAAAHVTPHVNTPF